MLQLYVIYLSLSDGGAWDFKGFYLEYVFYIMDSVNYNVHCVQIRAMSLNSNKVCISTRVKWHSGGYMATTNYKTNKNFNYTIYLQLSIKKV